MTKVKKYSTSVEVLDEPNPWLAAYKKVTGGELEPGEITVRGFAKLLTESGDKPVTVDAAENILQKMCKQGLAERVGEKVVTQDGLRPSMVGVYRLTNGKPDKS